MTHGVASPTPRHARPKLASDEGGAILVMGIIMCVFLVGILYYLHGIGTTVFFRERMQDAADATALGTAIGHARGMNLIVFINLVMAALVAILLALKIIEMMLTALMLILAAISWFVPPAAAAIPAVNSARQTVRSIHDAAEQIVDPLLRALHITERVLASIMPALAVGKTALDIQKNYPDVVADIPPLGIPTRITLPVQNDSYDVLCDRAADILTGLVKSVTNNIPFIGKVIGAVLGGLVDAVAEFFCKDSPNAPSLPVEFDRTLPISQNGLDCEKAQAEMSTDLSSCTDWQREQQERRPIMGTGECAPNNTKCEQNLVAARAQCDPRNGKLNNFSYLESNVTETLVFTADGWKTTKYEYTPAADIVNFPRFEDFAGTPADQLPQNDEPSKARPCDPQEIFGRGFNNGWSEPNPTVRDAAADPDDPTQVIPFCHRGRQEPPSIPAPEVGTTRAITYRAVQHVYGCSTKANRDIEIPAGRRLNGGGEEKSPQKMEDGVALGDENFQIRGFVIKGRQPSKMAEDGLKVAAWKRTVTPEGWVSTARLLGQFSMAQAEYYYNHDGTEDIKEWMWNMHWRARLVRFRLPERNQNSNQPRQGEYTSMAPPLDLNLNQVTPGGQSLGSIGDLIVH
jgi:hypothetical protein